MSRQIIARVQLSPMRFARAVSCVPSCVLACVLLVASCDELEPCGVPGVTETCPCGGGTQGARVCTADHTFAACDCTGAIPLPNAVDMLGATGGMGGRAGTSSGGAGGVGATGGGSMSGTTGGGAPPVDGGDLDDDSGMASGGNGGSGGSDTGGGGGVGGVVNPNEAYLGCASSADCQANAECVITPGFPASASFCAPPCLVQSDCPVPDGMYEAVVQCVTDYCKIDCTPVLFSPLLTCPTGMVCVAPLGGLSYCHDDGV